MRVYLNLKDETNEKHADHAVTLTTVVRVYVFEVETKWQVGVYLYR